MERGNMGTDRLISAWGELICPRFIEKKQTTTRDEEMDPGGIPKGSTVE